MSGCLPPVVTSTLQANNGTQSVRDISAPTKPGRSPHAPFGLHLARAVERCHAAAAQQESTSFALSDYLVSQCHDPCRQRHLQRLSGLQIEHELECAGLLDRKVRGLGTR